MVARSESWSSRGQSGVNLVKGFAEKSVSRKACLIAAAISTAGLMTRVANADLTDPTTNPNLIYKVLPSDFNVTTGILTPEVGPVGTISTAGAGVTINAVNGISSLVFNGTASFHLASALNNPSGNYTIFAVSKPTSSTSPETYVGGDTGSLQFRIDGADHDSGEPAILARGQFQYANASVPLSTTAFSVLDAVQNPTATAPNAETFFENGTLVGDAGAAGGFKTGQMTRFGSAASGSGDGEFFNGSIAELLVYNTSLSTSDRQTIEAQLAQTFGLQSNNFHFNVASGLYSTPSSWDQNAVPNNPTLHTATINNGGTAAIVSTDSIGLKAFYIGDASSGGTFGAVNQTGGSVAVTGEFSIGHNVGQGTYNMSGGSLSYTGSLNFAVAGNSSGGVPSVLNLSGNASVAVTGNGSVTIGEGSAASVGNGYGILNMSGTASFTTANGAQFLVGNDGAGTVGVVNISGGTITSGSWIAIGRESGTGTINLSGTGVITKANGSGGGVTFGGSDTGGFGTLIQTSGTFNNATSFTWLGEKAGSTGTWNISGGTANMQTVNVGLNGAGTLNVSGTAAFSTTNIVVASTATATGVINLNGGTLSTGILSRGSGTSAAVNLNGGTLQANADAVNFITGFNAGEVSVLAGGATIDTNSHAVTVSANLSSPTGVVGSLTKIGAGTLHMSGSNTYTGSTTISAGTLQLSAPSTPVPVPNFSFETPSVGSFQYNPTGASWTFTGQSGITAGGGFQINGPVPDGSQAGIVQNTGSISQALNFPSNGTYTVSFFSEQRNGGNSSPQALDVTIDGTDLSNFGFTPGATFAQTTYTVTETAGMHTLTFAGLDLIGGDETALIDDVQIYGNFGGTASTSIPGTSAVVIADNATLDLNGAAQQIGSLAGTSLSLVTLGSGTLITGGDSTSTTFAGAMSGTGNLVKIGTGTQTLSGSNTYTGGTNVSAGTLTFASTSAFPAFTSLSVGAGATASASNHSTGTKNTLFVSSLSLAGATGAWTGKVDLTNNDMVVRGGSLVTVSNQIAQGYANGTWNSSGGITSAAAANDPKHLTALGVIQNSADGTPTGNAIYTSFDGQTVADSDVLVKYTYYGDANLDGTVDGSDYTRIDNGYLTHSSGWFNGDFNYDGVIDGSDYTLIDNAFNTQGASLAAGIASPTAEVTAQIAGATAAVPEPATLSVIAMGALGLLGRRRRRSN